MVFTEYAETLDWIVRVLGQHGYREGNELAVIQGSTPAEEREDIRAKFTAPPDKQPVRVLVATDSAGEGIDLQAYCHRLVNFDIPFNPSRLEQRIGRIDRYGQEQTPEIYQLSPAESRSAYAKDVRFLLDKVRTRSARVAADLGSVNEVIDADIQDHFTPGGTGRKVKLSARDDGSVIINRVLAGGQELNRTLTELSRTYGDRKAEMHLTPANARRVVDTALELTAQPPLRPVRGRSPGGGLRGPRARPGVAVRAARPGDPAEPGRPAPGHVRREGGRGTGRHRLRPPRARAAPALGPHPARRPVQRGLPGGPRDRGRGGRAAAVLRRGGVAAGAGRARRPAAARGGVPHRHPAARQRHGRGEGRGGSRPDARRAGPGPGRRGRPPPAHGPVERRRRAAAHPAARPPWSRRPRAIRNR